MLWSTVLQNLLRNHSCRSHLYMHDWTQSTCMEGCSLCRVHTKLFLLHRQPCRAVLPWHCCNETLPWHCCRWYDAGQQLSGQQCLDRCQLPGDCAGAQCISRAYAVSATSHPGRISSHSSCGSSCPAGAAPATAAVTAGLPQAQDKYVCCHPGARITLHNTMFSMDHCTVAAETCADCHMHLMHELLLICKCIYKAEGIIFITVLGSWSAGLIDTLQSKNQRLLNQHSQQNWSQPFC